MKYLFTFIYVLTLIWLVALAFPQRDQSNGLPNDSILFDNNESSNTTPRTTATTTTTTTTTACPCVATAEYNPICGTDNVTYWNMGRFNCARNCNPRLGIRVLRACEPYIVQSSN
ncbi:hypothetical protein PUN28_006655 [Cardiocondyla obscurior]|uniref:Kazal-like domain-containing protein n=1 Tax=Cardiocondyla obscurior TaxID=286306 RepID=A0AAW2GEF4_9HYME